MYSLSALFLLAQAPPWMFPIAAASVTALATLAATGIALFATNRREQERLGSEERRERKRLEHEERMQMARLEHESKEAWRVERRGAYSVFFSLARRAKQTLDARQTEDWSTLEDKAAVLLEDLRVAHATVALVVGEEDLLRKAQAYYLVCKDILDGKDPSGLKEKYEDARNEFVESAREELGLQHQPWGSRATSKAFMRPRPTENYPPLVLSL
jgi:hypothetical protein